MRYNYFSKKKNKSLNFFLFGYMHSNVGRKNSNFVHVYMHGFIKCPNRRVFQINYSYRQLKVALMDLPENQFHNSYCQRCTSFLQVFVQNLHHWQRIFHWPVHTNSLVQSELENHCLCSLHANLCCDYNIRRINNC